MRLRNLGKFFSFTTFVMSDNLLKLLLTRLSDSKDLPNLMKLAGKWVIPYAWIVRFFRYFNSQISSPTSTSRIWLFSLAAREKDSRYFRLPTSLGRDSPLFRLNMLNFTERTRPKASGWLFTKASVASQSVTFDQLRILSLASKVAIQPNF